MSANSTLAWQALPNSSSSSRPMIWSTTFWVMKRRMAPCRRLPSVMSSIRISRPTGSSSVIRGTIERLAEMVSPRTVRTSASSRVFGRPQTLLDADVRTVRGDTISANLSIVPLMTEDEPVGLLILIEDITEGKRLQGAMRRFMTQKVVDQIMGREDELLFGSACQASVLFADIRNFTAHAEGLGPRY